MVESLGARLIVLRSGGGIEIRVIAKDLHRMSNEL